MAQELDSSKYYVKVQDLQILGIGSYFETLRPEMPFPCLSSDSSGIDAGMMCSCWLDTEE